jgi:predicted GNAT family N-acyltransferase
MARAQFNAMTVELFGTQDANRMREAIALRVRVFVEEQNVPLEEEVDDHDRSDSRAVHALIRAGAVAVATGRFYERDAQTVQIGRMAVDAAARGRGAGRMLLHALMDEARRRGYTRASLSAQLHARPFYEKSGFAAFGPLFLDAGIAHQEMQRPL